MVVLVIVGILVSFVGLSVGGDKRAEQLRTEAQRIKALVQLAHQEAIMRSEEFAVHFGNGGYQFLILQENHWTATSDDPVLRKRSLPEGMELRLELEDNPPPNLSADESDLPQVFLLSSGEMTPFELELSAEKTEVIYRVTASLLGDLVVE